MIIRILIYILVSVLYSLYSPRNRVDGNRFLSIKIFNSLAMLYVIALSAPNLLFLTEIISGKHEPVMVLESSALYYLYLISYIIVSGIIMVLAFFLFTRRSKARRLFLMIAPLMIVLTEIKTYNLGLGKEAISHNENYAMYLVVVSTSIWLLIYGFISLRITKKYFENILD